MDTEQLMKERREPSVQEILVKSHHRFCRWNTGPERASGSPEITSQLLLAQFSPLSWSMHISLRALSVFILLLSKGNGPPKSSVDGKGHQGWGLSGGYVLDSLAVNRHPTLWVGSAPWWPHWSLTDSAELREKQTIKSLWCRGTVVAHKTALIKTTKLYVREENEPLPL